MKSWPAVVVVFGLMLAACANESIRQGYRDGSDWLNNIPDPPPDGPWRLSKRIEPAGLAYPNLGDVPDRPAGLEAAQARDRELLEFERSANGTSLKMPPAKRAAAAELGAPPPASVAPLSIPPAN